MTDRRNLKYRTLAEPISEMQLLLEGGYVRNGNWSLAQIARHMRLTIDASVAGYPWWMSLVAPIRPLLRFLLLGKLLRGDSPAGLKTAGMFVPAGDLQDREEVDEFSTAVSRFLNHQGSYSPHPAFGRLKPELLEEFHAMHAAHHLGFLAAGPKADFPVNVD